MDSQNYALSGDMRFYATKLEQEGAVTRKYDAVREKGVTTSKNPTSPYFLRRDRNVLLILLE